MITVNAPDIEVLLTEARASLDRVDPDTAIRICESIFLLLPGHGLANYYCGEGYRMLRFLDEAEQYFRSATRALSSHSASWSGLGAVLFDQLRFAEAGICQNRALRCDANNAEAYHQRGLIRERNGDTKGAGRDFRRAYRLDPIAYPKPLSLDEDTITQVLTEVVGTLHPTIATYLSNVNIQVQDLPDTHVCMQYDPPAPPSEILGYFSGVALPEQVSATSQSFPGTLFLYRRNLERIAQDKSRILDELRATVFAEVGDYLGLTDAFHSEPHSD